MSSPPAVFDLFIDLTAARHDESAARAYLDRLAHDAGLAGVAGRVTLAAAETIRPGCHTGHLQVDVVTATPAIDALARAIRMAARARRHLVVLLGPLIPGSEIIAQLIAGFSLDPMLGAAQPRFAEPATDRIWPIPGVGEDDGTITMTSRASLLELPRDVITPELPACCLVLRWELLIGVELSDQAGRTLTGGLLHLLAYGRRLGLRNLIRNRVVLATSLAYSEIYPQVPATETEELYAIDEFASASPQEISNLSQRRAEALLEAGTPDANGRRRLLLDCRGMHPVYNGTTICMLGLLGGLARLDAEWDIHVLVSAETSAFHDLPRRFPRFDHRSDGPHGAYAAAVTMSQPWEIGRVAELHRHALAIGFLMLDVIAWDIFPGRTGMEATWHFIARHADGLFYISHFTRERFNVRFPVAPGVAEAVTHLSLAPENYIAVSNPADTVANDILIFGNHYDHKHIRPTAQLLADAFPFHKITVLGATDAPRQNVKAVASGQLRRAAVDGLIAGAGVIVFPSFYEGFGLPVVESLARGRTVLVRRSALWHEIAAHSRLPGRLCEFDDPASLVDCVGRVLAGLPIAQLPSGAALAEGTAAADWKTCAQRMIDLFVRRLAQPRLDHWWARENILRVRQ